MCESRWRHWSTEHTVDVEFVSHLTVHFLLILAQSDCCNFEVWGVVTSVTSAVVCGRLVSRLQLLGTGAAEAVPPPILAVARASPRFCRRCCSHFAADSWLPCSPEAG